MGIAALPVSGIAIFKLVSRLFEAGQIVIDGLLFHVEVTGKSRHGVNVPRDSQEMSAA